MEGESVERDATGGRILPGRSDVEGVARRAHVDEDRGLGGHLELLVGRDRRARRPRLPSGEMTVSPARVARRVDRDPEPLEARQRAGAHDRVVLADAGGEDDRVGAAERGEVGADVLADPVAVDVERELGGGVARARRGGGPRACRCRRPARAARCASSAPRRSRRSRGCACAAGAARAPGRRRPERVPITSPSSGVSPIDVSMLRPPCTAVALAPLPRCRTISRSPRARRATRAAARETYACEVPWKP